jgi:hypothetical protein
VSLMWNLLTNFYVIGQQNVHIHGS